MSNTLPRVPLVSSPQPAAALYGPTVQHTISLSDWLMKKARATVLDNIASHVLFLTGWAAMVTCVNQFTSAELVVSNQLLTVLGTVLGFVVSWRSSSAYDKYKEGVKLWSQLILGSRNLGSQIWFHIKPSSTSPASPSDELAALIEKRTMLNLIIGFSTAVKHYLRAESGIYYDDLYPYVSFLPRSSFPEDPMAVDPSNAHEAHTMPLFQRDQQHRTLATRSLPLSRSNSFGAKETLDGDGDGQGAVDGVLRRLPMLRSKSASADVESGSGSGKSSQDADREKGGIHHRRRRSYGRGISSGTVTPGAKAGAGALGMVDDEPDLAPGYNPPRADMYDWFPPLKLVRPFIRAFIGKGAERWRPGSKRRRQLGEANVPLQILLYLSSYIAHISHAKRMEPPLLSVIMGSLGILQDSLANLERVLTSPVPVAYQFHLRFTVWIYLLLLPFQVYNAFKWLTIPAVCVASIIYLGFVEIGSEIENPFGFDSNDLDLDWFACVVRKELAEIASHPPPNPASYVFTHVNKPFWPVEERCASDLMAAAREEGGEGGEQGRERSFGVREANRTTNKMFRDLSMVVGSA